jgi:hypothetical protein
LPHSKAFVLLDLPIPFEIKPVKTIHNKIEKKDLPITVWLAETKELESVSREQAIKEYKHIALAYPTNKEAYNRLMILFRQLKQVKNEMYWIDKAINSFQSRFRKPAIRANSNIAKLSRTIALSTGLSDKKGNAVYLPPPLDKWQKRKELLEKRMSKSIR